MSLANYRIVSGGQTRTFAQLGVTGCSIAVNAGGEDSATITVDGSFAGDVALFTPLAQHDIYAPGGTQPVWSGWLLQPTRLATAARQQQTFRLDGPMSLLAGIPMQQPWAFFSDPETAADPDATPDNQNLGRVILNAGSVHVAQQIQQTFAWFLGRCPVGIALGDTSMLPGIQPPEDEQTGISCAEAIKRQLRSIPAVSAYWSYGVTTTLDFRVGSDSGAGIVVDVASGGVETFDCVARHDLLLRSLTLQYIGEVETDPDTDGNVKIALTLAPETSTAENGSMREAVFPCRLRGLSDLYDAETAPLGLAAALHAPFKTLTHTAKWSTVRADVDWTATPGLEVEVQSRGSDLLAGSRPILQRITRDLRTGTTTYEAGPPAHLNLSDLLNLNRHLFSKSRNEARKDGHGGPGEQQYGFKDKDRSGPAGGGGGAGTCSTDARADNYYGNAVVMPCVVADGVPGTTTKVKIDKDDLASLGIPDAALPIMFRKIDACDDDGNPGYYVILASDFFADS